MHNIQMKLYQHAKRDFLESKGYVGIVDGKEYKNPVVST
jgi:hypothetical protein